MGRPRKDSEGRKARKKGKGPGRSYARLTRAERNSIERMLDRGESCRAMARELERSPSTVPDEVARHRFVTSPKSMAGAAPLLQRVREARGVRVRPQARRHQGACRRWPASPARTLRARRSRGRPDESWMGSRGPTQACLPKSSERHPATPPTGKTPKRKRLCGPRFVRLGAGTPIQPRVFG